MKKTYIFPFLVILCIFNTSNALETENNKDGELNKEKNNENKEEEINLEEEERLKEEKKIEKEKLDEEFEKVIRNRYKDIVLEENDSRKKMIRSELISASEAKPPTNDYISLGVIVCNVTKKRLVKGITRLFGRLIKSLLTYSKGTSLHIVVITDKKSFSIVHSVVVHTIGQFLSETILRLHTDRDLKWAHLSLIPSVWVEFIDLESITENHRETIDMMKKEYSMNTKEVLEIVLEPDPTDGHQRVASISPKYSEDLFYIGPFYGMEFTQIDRMIVVDADTAAREDLAYLEQYFDQMDSEEVIGITIDQAGYYSGTSQWIKDREKDFNRTFMRTDDPLKIRGLNTGVVLYNLDKMRRSETYLKYIEYDNIKQVKKDCLLEGAQFQLGDQDFFNTLMWREPQLFKTLPCEWNHQDTPVRLEKDFACKEKPKIVHKHGDIHYDQNEQN